ncbi:MAG: hypothetical protein UY01_C0022G0009 [Candidatus Nomurabacteria bacterium GW2011_GWB1_47_6]|uniref:Homeodomain phBC6A51-type domain-containing protein n=1 Tax=Candidatus Nomurabacteria bacterium GW2011_GWB1_47_6 TaxID=1618749 RepID=A0A0G1T057_9BACT|nr:MAG: hypothetical protein UY01_C0022G0009 [Candidatus Nomurabacteria bacterium GW2011_GWB1_47_6]
MAKNKTPQEKRLDTLTEDTEKKKKALVTQLRRTPIVQLACERVDVGRATYYKWRARDQVFARAADRAKKAGEFFINDMAESRLLRMIQDDNITAIIFWLKHNNPKYAVTTRVIHEHEVITTRPSVEETNAFAQHLAEIHARKIPLPETVEELKERIEEETADTNPVHEFEKKIDEYEEDTEVK